MSGPTDRSLTNLVNASGFAFQLAVKVLWLIVAVSAPALAEDGPRPPLDAETGRYQYQAVVEIPGVEAAELHSRARAWVAAAYKSAKDVTQLDDPNSGMIVVKGNFRTTYFMHAAWIRHTLMIEVKDGRYRYTLTDFVFDNNSFSTPLEEDRRIKGGRKTIYRDLLLAVGDTVFSLKQAMTVATPAADNDW